MPPQHRVRAPKTVAALAWVLLTSSMAWGELYSVADLGTLTDLVGQDIAKPYGINNSGKVVAATVVGGAYRALLYDGAWTNLGTLGGSTSFGYGLNDSLRAVGSSYDASGNLYAFLWTPGGTDGVPGNPQMKNLGAFGGSISEAYAINNAGQIAGYFVTGGGDYHAFRYSGGSITDIGALLGNKLPNSFGYSINAAGHVAGTAYDSKWSWNGLAAFFYNGSGSALIGPLPGGQYASALALNNSDQIVGYSATSTGLEHAFRYAGGVMTDLGTLPGGDSSYANGINNSNVIVGGSYTVLAGVTNYHAFIYASNGMADLNSLLNASGTGWVLEEARAINDAGQIAGKGTYGGIDHAFLLNPAPQITQQPTNLTVVCQTNATFRVAATPLPLTYQWYLGSPPAGSSLANATNATLTLSNVTCWQTADYYVVVSNRFNGATSSVVTLTVLDSTPPVISDRPANQTNYTAPGLCSAVVVWPNPTALDACDGVVPVTSTPANGSSFSKGITTVVCQASDSCRNTNTYSFTVTVLDNQAPIISGCPADPTNFIASGATNAVVSWPTPTAMDNCDGVVPVTSNPVNGSTFNLGTTTVTCWAGDSSGNTNTTSFTITLIQAQPPAITGLEVQGTNVLLSFTTQNGANYAIDHCPTPTNAWNENVVTGIIGNGGTVSVTNSGDASAASRFYRVKLTLP